MRLAGKSIAGRSADRVCALGIAHVPQGRGTFNDRSGPVGSQAGGGVTAKFRPEFAEI